MSDGFDQLLKETLYNLAAEGRPTNLANQAIRQGRQIARRRNAGVASVCAIAMVLVMLPFALFNWVDSHRPVDLGGMDRPQQPTSAAGTATVHPALTLTEAAATLPGSWMVASIGTGEMTTIYDRVRKVYRQLPYPVAVIAPTGSMVAVQRGVSTPIGLLDLTTGSTKWVAGPSPVTTTLDWSRDGQRLLYAGRGASASEVQAAVLDVATGNAVAVTQSLACAEGCAPHWLPGEKEVGFNQLSADPDKERRIRAFNADTGAVTRDVELPGEVLSSWAWSPDGRYVIVSANDHQTTEIVEVDTGKIVAVLGSTGADAQTSRKSADPGVVQTYISSSSDVYWVTTDRLLAVESTGVAQYALDGTRTDIFPLPATIDSRRLGAVLLTPIG